MVAGTPGGGNRETGRVLEIEGLERSYGDRPVLRGLDLRTKAGLLAVLGASGSGKTTLLRLICGFEAPQGGRIRLEGRRLQDEQSSLPPEARRISYVPQDGGLFPHLSVGQNILFGFPKEHRRETAMAAALLEQVGLPSAWTDRRVTGLSGGERQRVALARALAPRPALLLLDEPFAALDSGLRLALRDALASILRAAGTQTILVTHDQAEALSLADSVAVLSEGRFAQVAAPSAIYGRPVSLAVARLTGEVNLLAAIATGGAADCALGQVALHNPPCTGACRLMLRPEQIGLWPVSSDRPANAAVLRRAFLGRDVRLALALQAGGETVTAFAPAGHAFAVGERCHAAVKGAAQAYA
jgi:iron(III) transport system ATP-binding protein